MIPCFLAKVRTGGRNPQTAGGGGGQGPWEFGCRVSATSVLRFRVGHHISPRLPDQRSYVLIHSGQRPLLELWDLSLKPASYVDVSEMRPRTQTREAYTRDQDGKRNRDARRALLSGHSPALGKPSAICRVC